MLSRINAQTSLMQPCLRMDVILKYIRRVEALGKNLDFLETSESFASILYLKKKDYSTSHPPPKMNNKLNQLQKIEKLELQGFGNDLPEPSQFTFAKAEASGGERETQD